MSVSSNSVVNALHLLYCCTNEATFPPDTQTVSPYFLPTEFKRDFIETVRLGIRGHRRPEKTASRSTEWLIQRSSSWVPCARALERRYCFGADLPISQLVWIGTRRVAASQPEASPQEQEINQGAGAHALTFLHFHCQFVTQTWNFPWIFTGQVCYESTMQ